MNRAMKYLIFVFLITVLASGCSHQAGKPITQIIAFGNEFADIGAGQRITTKDVENKVTDAFIIPASPLYWQGRWSNGPLAVEVLAQQLGVKLTSYAVFGAFSSSWNLIELSGGAGINDTGLQSQIRQFKAELNGKEADPDALYYIVMTRNDYWMYSDQYGVNRISYLADTVITNIETAVTDLAGSGAKQFFILNEEDLLMTPGLNHEGRNVEIREKYQTHFNTQLPIKMEDLEKKLQIEITVFDVQAVSEEIRNKPQKYGLTNLTGNCLVDYWATTACENPDEYYFWDPYNWTRKVHQIYGEAMAAVYED